MILEEVTGPDYERVVAKPYHVFASAGFNALNEHKVDRVVYLLFKDSKYRLGLIGAISDNMLLSPFSAPFGSFTFIQEDVRIKAIDEATALTEKWCLEKGIREIRYTMPPPIYHESYLAKLSNVLYRAGYTMKNMELNFHFDLSKFTDGYLQMIWRNARKNLKIGLAGDLSFMPCSTVEQKQRAYAMIQLNRKERGKPLRMTFEQLINTASVIPADFFLVTHEESPVASAIVFTVAPDVAMVIYWGDDPSRQPLKTMNYLSYKVFEFYKQRNYRMVDIGYSTEESVPNFGLCEFKESLGCDIQPKMSYHKVV